MSTLSIRSLHVPQVSFARFAAKISAVLDVLAEAQEMARTANKRYPFIEG